MPWYIKSSINNIGLKADLLHRNDLILC